jgi:hypothetical protein
MSRQSRILLLGLKGSGKTSYLSALWHVAESREIDCQLFAAALQPDRKHLNKIRDEWIAFKQATRTSARGEQTVSMSLQTKDSAAAVDLVLPDLSGESFRQQWDLRHTTPEYVEFVRDCTGVAVFIHPDSAVKFRRLPGKAETQTTQVMAKETEWSPDKTPTQVQLVELLQFICELRADANLPKVAVLVSAWDKIKTDISPVKWLEGRMPLLSQYLSSNVPVHNSRYYGISAVGGDLVQDRERLTKEHLSSNRIQVIDGVRPPHHDPTIPISFLLGLDSPSPVGT